MCKFIGEAKAVPRCAWRASRRGWGAWARPVNHGVNSGPIQFADGIRMSTLMRALLETKESYQSLHERERRNLMCSRRSDNFEDIIVIAGSLQVGHVLLINSSGMVYKEEWGWTESPKLRYNEAKTEGTTWQCTSNWMRTVLCAWRKQISIVTYEHPKSPNSYLSPSLGAARMNG